MAVRICQSLCVDILEDRGELCGSPIVSCWGVDIQFVSRMATFVSWGNVASHLVSVKLTTCYTRGSISSVNCTALYAYKFYQVPLFGGEGAVGGGSLPSLVWGEICFCFQVLAKLPGNAPFHPLSRGVLYCLETASVSLLWSLRSLGIGFR